MWKNRYFYAEYTIGKNNFAKLLNRLNREKIEVFGIKYSFNSVKFCVPLHKNRKVLAIFQESLYNDIVIDIKSPFTILKRHAGVVVGILTFLIVMYVSSLFVFGVDIRCDNVETSKEIQNIITQNGYDNFMLKSVIDEKSLEKSVMGLHGVSFAEVNIKGSKLVIYAKRAVEPNEIVARDNIIANMDGVVTRVLTLSGTAETTVGSVVKSGDVLIGGYVVGRDGNAYEKVDAKGSVWAEVEVSSSVKVMDNGVNIYATNQSKSSYRYEFFGKTYVEKDAPYDMYNASEKKVFSIGIFSVYKTTYTKLDYTFFENQFEDVRDKAMAELYEQEWLKVGDGRIINRELQLIDYKEYKLLTLITRAEMKITED